MSNKTCNRCGAKHVAKLNTKLNAKQITLAEPADTVELNYRATKSSITTIRGRRESMLQPLVASYGKPTGGWQVQVRVKGIPCYFTGNSGMQVFNALKKHLKANDVVVSDLDIWLNLNIQWLSKLPEKHKLVRTSELMALAAPNDKFEIPTDPSARNYTPADWGAKAWDMLGAYLAQDTYLWEGHLGFLTQLLIVQQMLNNDMNPSIGCNECYLEFTKELDVLRSNPLYSAEKAKEWLHKFHNLVNARLGKPQVSYRTAKQRYLWA